MDYVWRGISAVSSALSDVNQATLSGAVDVIVVEQEDGSLASTPFHVRFGKMHVLKAREKVVSIAVNGERVPLNMKLGPAGEAFFVREMMTQDIDEEGEFDEDLMTSPIPSPLLFRAGATTPPVNREEGEQGDVPHPMLLSTRPTSAPLLRTSINTVDDDEIVARLATSPDGSWQWGWGQLPIRVENTDETTEKLTNMGRERGWMGSILNSIWRGRVTDRNNHTLSGPIPTMYRRFRRANSESMVQSSVNIKHDSDIVSDADTVKVVEEEKEEEEQVVDDELQFPMEIAQEDTLRSLQLSNTCHVSPAIEKRMSLCGHLLADVTSQQEFEKIYLENIVEHSMFISDPLSILGNLQLVVAIDGFLLSGSNAVSMILSTVLYDVKLRITGDGPTTTPPPQPTLPSIPTSKTSSWFWFRRNEGVVEGEEAKEEEEKEEEVENDVKQDIDFLPITGPTDELDDDQFESGEGLKWYKSTRPSASQLKELGLRLGENTIEFTVTSTLQGKAEVSAFIYLWPKNTQIVVTDIDGTITRSDVMGQLLPLFGKDWTHQGIVRLLHRITGNGYRVMYLSSRPIGQAQQTRGYLNWVQQEKKNLPPGPLIMSPDRLLVSFTREVLRRRPEEFKIQCLSDIKALFKENYTPFYGGFGNRLTDTISYRSVGIQTSKIFIVNPQGVVVVPFPVTEYRTTYKTLYDLCDEVFPPVQEEEVYEEYNSWNFWRVNPPDVVLDV